MEPTLQFLPLGIEHGTARSMGLAVFNSLSYRACFETRHIPPKLRKVTINAFGFYFSPAGKIRLYN